MKQRLVCISAILLSVATGLSMAQGLQRYQRPFLLTEGDTVTPAYEGWYPNPDGSISVSYGYYNRNSEEVVHVPIGPDNHLTPENTAQSQPDHFQPRRHYGIFSVTIPAGYDGEVWWTLNLRGEKVSIPANLGPDFKIDAMGPTIMGNFPPGVAYSANGEESYGPQGQVIGPLIAKVGHPLSLDIWVKDDGVRRIRGDGRDELDEEPAVANLDFIKFRGPGNITFEEQRLKYFASEGSNVSKTMIATFDTPGNYRIRALASDASGVRGDEQCCWTNTYIDVEVAP